MDSEESRKVPKGKASGVDDKLKKEESKTRVRNRKKRSRKDGIKIMPNTLTKTDYSFYYESSVWDQYEDFVYAI